MIEQSLSLEFRDGVYSCNGCGVDLFSSDQKFAAKNNYPSFRTPLRDGLFSIKVDEYGIENLFCSNCGQEIGGLYYDASLAGDKSENKDDTRYLTMSDRIKFTPSNPDQVNQIPEDISHYELKVINKEDMPFSYTSIKTVNIPPPKLRAKKKKVKTTVVKKEKSYSIYCITGAILSFGLLGAIGYYFLRKK